MPLPSGEAWTIRDACEGTQVFGASGSGKTSGSGQTIGRSFLAAGMGGLVLTAKPEEADQWRTWCADAGRSEDLIIFSPQTGGCFNFLDYEQRRPGVGAGLTQNIAQLFVSMAEVGQGGDSKGSSESARFFRNAMLQLLRNSIDLVAMTQGTLNFEDLHRLIISAPTSKDDMRDADWRDSSFCWQCLLQAEAAEMTPQRRQDYKTTSNFWTTEWPGRDAKLRGDILGTLTTMADSFMVNPFHTLFCTKTNTIPEHTFIGKIIVVDLPVKEYDVVGQYAQALWKACWQRAVERRDITRFPNPVFLWADEAHFFVNSNDTKFQSTARSKRACTVYLTQSINSYLEELGGPSSRPAMLSLLGNLGTKIFHANGDYETNNYAADTIGKNVQWRSNSSVSNDQQTFSSNMMNGASGSHGGSEQVDYQVPPIAFTTLPKGGPHYDFQVGAYVFQGGRIFKASGANYVQVRFGQRQ